MCSGVPELCLSFAEAHARFHRIVFEVNSIYTILRLHRPQRMRPSHRSPPPSFLLAASLLPTHRQASSSGFYLPLPPNNRHPSPCWSPATTHFSRDSASGILFACMHGYSWSQWCSQLCSGVATYSISQLLEILSPILTVWLHTTTIRTRCRCATNCHATICCTGTTTIARSGKGENKAAEPDLSKQVFAIFSFEFGHKFRL
uniref:Uncharacterized protein n=1 Tax=Oryza glumipatula TaxID=40148 RepID=A0A0D9YRA8_9ORYZ